MDKRIIVLEGSELETVIEKGLMEIHDECPSTHITLDIQETCDSENLHRSTFKVTFVSLPF